jgi:hypothetical protein
MRIRPVGVKPAPQPSSRPPSLTPSPRDGRLKRLHDAMKGDARDCGIARCEAAGEPSGTLGQIAQFGSLPGKLFFDGHDTSSK